MKTNHSLELMRRHKKRLIVIGATLAVLLLVVVIAGVVAVLSQGGTKDPYKTNDTQPPVSTPAEPAETSAPASRPAQADTPSIDPTTVSTVTIEPLGVIVSYKKGIGFEYAVKRADAGTQYVDFSNASLVGNRCTNDQGIFASIIKNPTGTDAAAVTTTKKVGNDTYGLILPGVGCTGDPTAFATYQASFKDAFPLLKPLEASADTTQ